MASTSMRVYRSKASSMQVLHLYQDCAEYPSEMYEQHRACHIRDPSVRPYLCLPRWTNAKNSCLCLVSRPAFGTEP
jgi:hypothetical protein